MVKVCNRSQYPSQNFPGGKMNAPGVVIEERGARGVAANTSPTVPAFIGLFHKADGSRYGSADCFRIADMSELRRAFPNLLNMRVEVTATTAKVYAIGNEYGYAALALEHYFINGGGPCYILPSASGNDKAFSEQILRFPEISLITVVDPTTAADGYYAALESLLDSDKGYFAIRHLNTSNTAPKPLGPGPHRSLYHPWLNLTHSPWRNDSAIPISGAGASGATTLAELRNANPAVYALADVAVKKQILAFASTPLPPSAAVAAAYCKTDRDRGVWRAPANIVISQATPYLIVTANQQGPLNESGINVIRWMNKQTTIYGARTADVDSQWKYVPVRRLFNQVQRDVSDMLRSYLFEPNTRATWVRAKASIESHLHKIWQAGGLAGGKPEQGYIVTIDDSTMKREDIDGGRMIARIQMAPVKPAEFIVLQFTQNLV